MLSLPVARATVAPAAPGPLPREHRQWDSTNSDRDRKGQNKKQKRKRKNAAQPKASKAARSHPDDRPDTGHTRPRARNKHERRPHPRPQVHAAPSGHLAASSRCAGMCASSDGVLLPSAQPRTDGQRGAPVSQQRSDEHHPPSSAGPGWACDYDVGWKLIAKSLGYKPTKVNDALVLLTWRFP